MIISGVSEIRLWVKWFGYFIIVSWIILCTGCYGEDYIWVILGNIVAGLIYVFWSIVFCKTIVLNERGCEIRYNNWRKAYSWSEMRYRSWLDYDISKLDIADKENHSHKGCFLFMTNEPKFSLNAKNTNLAVLLLYVFHPFSCFLLHYETRAGKKAAKDYAQNGKSGGFYEVNKEEFHRFVESIGLCIEDMPAIDDVAKE